MCAIAGIVNSADAKPQLENMLKAMHHRGPDYRGVWIEDGCHLGHNRLSIIDLSPDGHQPMVSASGRYVIVYNGEVYNFLSLREELTRQGVVFRSRTDTEVILALWELEQDACIHRLRGMFAFGIWDRQTNTLTLVRDRLGIKPLYYAQTPSGFVFASEIKGMLASGMVDKAIDPVAIALVLQKGYVQQPHTILESVSALQPGHILKLKGGGVSTNSYWRLENRPSPYGSEEEAIAAIRQMVIESVNMEMISDKPVGVFLSGGLDSTVLVAALRAAGHRHIKTFTVGFDSTDKEQSEAQEAKASAEFYGTTHFDLQVERGEVWSSIDKFIDAVDQPSVDGFNVWLVSKMTAEHVAVALSGLGGDELFSGYSIDHTILEWKENRNLFLNAIRVASPAWRLIPRSFKLRRFLEAKCRLYDFVDAYLSWGEILDAKAASRLAGLRDSCQRRSVYELFAGIDCEDSKDLLQRIARMHLHAFMSGRVLPVSDAFSMAHSLEVRFPLIDYRLVETAFNLPCSWKVKNAKGNVGFRRGQGSFGKGGVKHILFQAFKSELPEGFGKRYKKGFALPFEEWLRTDLQEELKSVFFDSGTYFPPHALQDLYCKWQKGMVGWTAVWVVFVLEKWINRNIVSCG